MTAKLPILITTHKIIASNKGLKLMDFKASNDNVEPIRNRVKFNPNFEILVIVGLTESKIGK